MGYKVVQLLTVAALQIYLIGVTDGTSHIKEFESLGNLDKTVNAPDFAEAPRDRSKRSSNQQLQCGRLHVSCFEDQSPLILRKLDALQSTVNELRNSTKSCSQGWTEYQSFCYRVVSRAVTWDQARTACKAEQADLVKITSDGENDFVLKLTMRHASANKFMWIGLHWRKAKQYHWQDGSLPRHYSNWAPSEPNGWSREPCGHMYTDPTQINVQDLAGLWNDVSCMRTYGYVCEKLK